MKRKRAVMFFGILLVTLFVAIILSLAIGSKSIPFSEVIEAILHPVKDNFNVSVVQERIPRTVFALLAGGALAVSGLLMQSVTRNPIADPSILGINSGASLAVVSGLVFFQIHSATEYILFALVGALLAAFAVYVIASLGGSGATPLKLALAGATMSGAISSVVSMLFLPFAESLTNFRMWQVGSLGGVTWSQIIVCLPFILLALLIAFLISPSLNAIMLGDEMATSLGVHVNRTRLISTIAGVILCATVTALAGPIGFVGLMIPHMMRLLVGNNIKVLVPFSLVGGSTLLLLSDVIGRVIASPYEVEVGIITAIIGAPVFIYVAMKTKVRSL